MKCQLKVLEMLNEGDKCFDNDVDNCDKCGWLVSDTEMLRVGGVVARFVPMTEKGYFNGSLSYKDISKAVMLKARLDKKKAMGIY